MSRLLGLELRFLGVKIFAFSFVVAIVLAAGAAAPPKDGDRELTGSKAPDVAAEATDPDAEGDTGEIEEGEGEIEEGSDGTVGEIEAVKGFNESATGQSVMKGNSGEGEITPYEEVIKLPTIESVLERMDPDERSEIFDAPESVCGNDERVRITPTTQNPWRWNCQLIITLQSGGKARGTGFLIGNGTVMTAGHCVHPGKGGNTKFYKQIEVIPGMDGSNRPYGTYFGYSSKNQLRSVVGWKDDGLPTHDYGAIILDNGKPGKAIGYFGWAVYPDSTLNGMFVNTAGYPGDKPSGTQWFMAGKITSVEARRLHYMIDTYAGQSGQAVYQLTGGNRYAVGIHAYGNCPNKATRIVTAVSDNMKNWRALGQ
jgi:glutamyl endopeptidase